MEILDYAEIDEGKPKEEDSTHETDREHFPTTGEGVTILMNNYMLTTQPPVLEDQKFLQQASHWIREYQKENPRG